MLDKTIVAVATPPGVGGVAIIRISGKEAVKVVNRLFSLDVTSFKSHTVHYGILSNLNGEKIDDVLVIPMLGKNSYTGEDTVEIHCHGGRIVTESVLQATLSAGASPAGPGEFTYRAYMNGRLDLAQAEAVQALIGAKNSYAMHAAHEQLEGGLSTKVRTFQEGLTDIAAVLEAWVDFPDEDLEGATLPELEPIIKKIETLLNTFHDGLVAREGALLCLVGRPNAGKSSLMNALLEKERAIVTHLPGTTRDTLEEAIIIHGLNYRLIDTAGIRDTDEIIEKEGVERSKKSLKSADLVLLVIDSSDPNDIEELEPDNTIIVWNKCDLSRGIPKHPFPHQVQVSAKTGEGIETLKKMIDSVVWDYGPPSTEEILLISLRHREALEIAFKHLQKVSQGIQDKVSPEFIASDMRAALTSLSTILGTNITEDILSAIFSKFCIGK